MKQVMQDLTSGEMLLVDAPAPMTTKVDVNIATTKSLISLGTERTLVDFGKAGYIQKAMQQPEKVKMVLDKVKTDGLLTTIETVRSKLTEPMPLGYCNVGVVTAVGSSVKEFAIGDRVVSNGPHADLVRVSKNLCAKIPDNVSDESAVFTVLGSIGLQGIRLLKPTLGESIVVVGVGLIGLITVQLLKASGCRVLAIDYDCKKLELAKQYGAEVFNPATDGDVIEAGIAFSRGAGVDGVIITASTKSNDPVTNAAQMSRKRGRIILVGVTGLQLNRADFYEKELTFQVSCSYGPGRYDKNYEDRGEDYPIGFVRWTEQRNFEAILDMMSSGALKLDTLISHKFDFTDAKSAYGLVSTEPNALGIMLEYNSDVEARCIKEVVFDQNISNTPSEVSVGFVGAGNYASRVLIPAFKSADVNLEEILTSKGLSGAIHGKKAGFTKATTDTDAFFTSSNFNLVVIATQHNSHGKFVIDALKNDKHVFVEKPLALTMEQINAIKEQYKEKEKAGKTLNLMVGFNRRFSPHVKKMKELLGQVSDPKSFIITVNAGEIPDGEWPQDWELGGGRIIGEGCHFIDLMRFLAGSKIVSIQTRRIDNLKSSNITEDKAVIILGFEDGSFGTINYLANGSSKFPKERIEVFVSGRVLQLDNFIKLKAYGWPGFKKMNLWKQDKGQVACAKEVVNAIKEGKGAPIPIDEIFEIAEATIQASTQLREQV